MTALPPGFDAGTRLTMATHAPTHFQWELTDGVATVTLNRPDRKNPLTFESYAELRASTRRERNEGRATIGGISAAFHPAIPYQLLGEQRDVPTRHHEIARQRVEAEPLRMALKLREIIEARQCDIEALAQPRANLLFDLRAAREEPQPQAHRRVIGRLHAGLLAQLFLVHHVHMREAFAGRHATSPRRRSRRSTGPSPQQHHRCTTTKRWRPHRPA